VSIDVGTLPLMYILASLLPAFSAYDAVSENDEETLLLLVPNSDPVIPPNTLSDPVNW
jgi:hypothetical protein